MKICTHASQPFSLDLDIERFRYWHLKRKLSYRLQYYPISFGISIQLNWTRVLNYSIVILLTFNRLEVAFGALYSVPDCKIQMKMKYSNKFVCNTERIAKSFSIVQVSKCVCTVYSFLFVQSALYLKISLPTTYFTQNRCV